MRERELLLASEQGNVHTITRSLENGVYINVKGENQNTPLHVAALNGRTEAVALLLKAGADVDAKNSGVYSIPLDFYGSENIRFKIGHVPIQSAEINGHKDVMAVIIAHKILQSQNLCGFEVGIFKKLTATHFENAYKSLITAAKNTVIQDTSYFKDIRETLASLTYEQEQEYIVMRARDLQSHNR